MRFPLSRRAGKDDGHRIRSGLVETIDDPNLIGVLEFDRGNSLPPSRPLDRLVVHVVIPGHRPVLT
jgi:hypothetical protein